jgi:hypothetical protein
MTIDELILEQVTPSIGMYFNSNQVFELCKDKVDLENDMYMFSANTSTHYFKNKNTKQYTTVSLD